MTETKTPQSGEWWRSNDGTKTVFICGFDEDGDPVYKRNGDLYDYEMATFLSCFHHEPRCTGFDWQEPPAVDPGEGWELLPVGTVLDVGDEAHMGGNQWKATTLAGCCVERGTYRRKIKPAEVWPKWYVLDETQGQSDRPWAIERYTTNKSWRHGVEKDGSISKEHNSFPLIIPVMWKEVTESEALARVTPPEPEFCTACGVHLVVPGTKTCGYDCALSIARQPVESPDDWVEITDSDHLLRFGIDQFVSKGNEYGDWKEYLPLSKCAKYYVRDFRDVRCKRKDLPVPVPAVKRLPVRLWVHKDCRNSERYNVFVKISPPAESDLYKEILHDADGFFVEVTE